jgi:hypothetical protein
MYFPIQIITPWLHQNVDELTGWMTTLPSVVIEDKLF